MEVYIEWVILSNFLTSGITLFAATSLCHIRLSLLRLNLASLAGGLLSLLVIVADNSLQLVLRLSVGLLLCFICVYQQRKLKALFRFYTLFICANIILLGCVYLLMNVFNVSFMAANGIIYADNAVIVVLLGIFAGMMLTVFFSRMSRRAGLISHTECMIIADGIEITTLIDTGNKLCTPITRLPVMIVDAEVYQKFGAVSDNLAIPFRTVSGRGIIYGFEPKQVVIKYMSEERKSRLVIARAQERIIGEFSAIVGPTVLY